MHYTIDSLYQEIFSEVNKVYDIFKNFFTEERTDLQNLHTKEEFKHEIKECFNIEGDSFELSQIQLQNIKKHYENSLFSILVWWKEVKVTNEYGKFETIYDLYAEIQVTLQGNIPAENQGFKLCRTTFTVSQFNSGYIHSHVPARSGTSIVSFQTPCLGRGPIKNTIMSLKAFSDNYLWHMFCVEIDKYVTVESIEGVPYIKLETIHARNKDTHYCYFTQYSISKEPMLKDFMPYYLKKGDLKINYNGNEFAIDTPFWQLALDMSNCFIKYFNENGTVENCNTLYQSSTLLHRVISNGGIYYTDDIRRQDVLTQLSSSYILKFKQRMVKLKIIEVEVQRPSVTLLNPTIINYIINSILKILNYRFKNERTHISTSIFEASELDQKVRYI